MQSCPSCGRAIEGAFAFCPHCGAKLGVAAGFEQRKTVTALFCDVTGSTSLGESIDPEALRALLARYFERMSGIVEAHGGLVEKFIGDAVVAFFGIPTAHEDDALRAVRAAAEMREALPQLGIRARIGVNTGEVVTATHESLATGDAVNVAARLQQAAQPNEILIGEPTFALVRRAVEVEAVEPLTLKGKGQPVPAYRLLCVREAPDRDHEAAFIGRRQELSLVREAWERVRSEQRCELVTVVGDAGVGKSRLVAEFLAGVEGEAPRGRCLPYGEGITYWPVVEVVQQLSVLPPEPAAAAAIQSLLGESDAITSADEIAWGFRKTLEHAAAKRPLVVVFDDIQWGEEAFHDLIEHVALLSSGVPLLLLCLARPELSERRPAWSVTLRLEPLGDDDVEHLIGERVSPAVRKKITRAAGGNPLFVQEMLAMADDAEVEVTVPPTLWALLAARLDQLDATERGVLERGAVEGELFHGGAVQALAADGLVTPRLAALVRKGLIRPDRPQLRGEDAFRFRHLLIRDAAYASLPKSVRAELHERFAAWLVEHGAELVELDELVGYHLEQACRYLASLSLSSTDAQALARRAATHLGDAGRRALVRRDLQAATNLLERARALAAAESRLHRQLGLEVAHALDEVGNFDRALAVLEEVKAAALNERDDLTAAHAQIDALQIRLSIDPEGAAAEGRDQAETALPAFEAAGDHLGIAKALLLAAEPDHMLARFEPWRRANEEALVHLRTAADRLWVPGVLGAIVHAVTIGPTSVREALARLHSIVEEAPDDRYLRARVRVRMGLLMALAGHQREAVEAESEAEALLLDLGVAFPLGSFGLIAGNLELVLGRLDRAEQRLLAAAQIFERARERSVRSTALAALADVLARQGRLDEAESTAQLAIETGSSDDFATLAWAQGAIAMVLARREQPGAVEAARRAVTLVEQTDILWMQGEAWEILAAALLTHGHQADATAACNQALARYHRKGATALVARVRGLLAATPSHE